VIAREATPLLSTIDRARRTSTRVLCNRWLLSEKANEKEKEKEKEKEEEKEKMRESN